MMSPKQHIQIGIIAQGGIAIGIVAIGGVSIGIVALGGAAFGLLALGGLAIGGMALGGIAVGWKAVGALTFALGGVHGLQSAIHAGQALVLLFGRAGPPRVPLNPARPTGDSPAADSLWIPATRAEAPPCAAGVARSRTGDAGS